METKEFIREQFITLRDEIKETKARMFKLAGFGIFSVPAAQFVAKAFQLDIITIALPLLVVIVTLLYLSENHALMRCGRYIRKHIEPKISSDIVGWEAWLEEDGRFERRTVDKFLSYSFYMLFFIYYVGALYMAGRFVYKEFGIILLSVLISFYSAIGIWFVVFLIKNNRTCTTTLLEKTDSDCKENL